MANVENLKPWPKGVSGNPGGRPKRKPFHDAIDEELSNEEAREIIRDAVNACKGKHPNMQALHFLRDTYEGKPTERVELEADIKVSSKRALIAKRRAERLASIEANVVKTPCLPGDTK